MTNLAARVKRVPHGCVWEITTACNLRCVHCEVCAGEPRADELDSAAMLRLADDLADLGCRRVSLTGGEPLLRKDWPQIASRLSARGLAVKMVTNGLLLDDAVLQQMCECGVTGVAVSVDGLRDTHDNIRLPASSRGSHYELALQAIERLARSPLRSAAITQINRRNFAQLDELHEVLRAAGADTWQLQLAYPLGRVLTDTEDYILRPQQLPELESRIGHYVREGAMAIVTADNIGYYGRDEPLLRFGPKEVRTFWMGCMAGCLGVALMSNGGVKGCPTQPEPFVVGNVRDEPLSQIWSDRARFAYNTEWNDERLEGACAVCDFRRVCRAGCTTMAYAVTGTIYNNPLCLQRCGS